VRFIPPGKPTRYGLLLFPQWEVLDVFGPIEALNTLPRLDTFPLKDELDMAIIAESMEPMTSGPIKGDKKPFNPRIAQTVNPTHTFDNAPDIDVLLVPGGWGAGPTTRSGFEPNVDKVVKYIKDAFPRLQYLISGCSPASYS
jgi:putative intracellular protease/amidase